MQFPFVRPAWQEQPVYKINVMPQFCQTEQSHCYILKLLAETYVQWPCKTSFSRHCMWRLISECCFWFAHGVPFLFGRLQWIMADLLFHFLFGLRSISSTARLSEISLWCGVTSWKSFFIITVIVVTKSEVESSGFCFLWNRSSKEFRKTDYVTQFNDRWNLFCCTITT